MKNQGKKNIYLYVYYTWRENNMLDVDFAESEVFWITLKFKNIFMVSIWERERWRTGKKSFKKILYYPEN